MSVCEVWFVLTDDFFLKSLSSFSFISLLILYNFCELFKNTYLAELKLKFFMNKFFEILLIID